MTLGGIDHRGLVSGQHRGLAAALARSVLRLASGVYGIGQALDRLGYDLSIKTVNHADVPVICIGNITTGGTGKTPIVCDVCRRLRERGLRVAIISRGYGGLDDGQNDEAKELYARLPDVPHVQDPNRHAAALVATQELESEIIVMDDGYQHRRLFRDVNVLVVDATCPFGFGYLLPRGYLREPLSAIRRADAVIITRADQVDGSVVTAIEAQVRRWNPSAPIATTEHAPVRLVDCRGDSQPITRVENQPVAVLSAIGNPDAFEATVTSMGAIVAARRDLPDHHPYDRPTRDSLREWINALGEGPETPTFVLCTRKDLVKLQTDRIAGVPVLAVEIDLHWRDGLDAVWEAIEECY
ncbi:MAG: tetraacyldisaccharide 4'-kinase [Planctomycetota bacterium]